MKQEMMGWQWHQLDHMQSFALCCRHIITPAPHHSIFTGQMLFLTSNQRCQSTEGISKLEMWANAQRDGRPTEYRLRPLFNEAVWLTPTTKVPCSNAAKTRNPLKLHVVPQTNETISAANGPKFTILWGHVGEILHYCS